MMDGEVVITRHLVKELPDYAFASDQKPLAHTPAGFELTRPFPDARVFFIDNNTQANGGWIYVYWITEGLMHPRSKVEIRNHIEMEG